MTLREVFEVYWDIVEIHITARNHDLSYLHQWQYGPDIHESIHMWSDRKAGKLTIVDKKINAHGDPVRNGIETGWGVKEKIFPEQILDAKITHFLPSTRSGGDLLYVDIELDPVVVEILKKTIKGRPLEEENDEN